MNKIKCILENNDKENDAINNDECYITFDLNINNTSNTNNNTNANAKTNNPNDIIVTLESTNTNNESYRFYLIDLFSMEESIIQNNSIGIVYVNGHHFFQSNVKIVFRGHGLQEIKRIISIFRSSNIRNGTSCIIPSHFYNSPLISSPLQIYNEYKVFNRQDDAFKYFDNLGINLKNVSKVYSFESTYNGTRKFLVADYDSFFKYYCPKYDDNNSNNSSNNNGNNNNSRSNKRHVYEIIRCDYPCRAYFDLEYNISSNPTVIGDVLTAKWISLVIWKVYDLWGVCLSKENILVFDSSNIEKYSKHVSLIIPHPQPRHNNNYGNTNITNEEILFRNNFHVGALIELILDDITEPIEETLPQTSSSPNANTNNNTKTIRGRIPKSMYDDLWVNNKDNNKRTCFIDLGVYTKNRMFRLLWSSKYGKDTILNHLHSDKQFCSSSTKRKLENDSNINVRDMKNDELKKSFIVPFNAHEYLINNNNDNCSNDSFLCLNIDARNLKDYKVTNEENSKIVKATVLSSSMNNDFKDREIDSSSKANNKRNESPFPKLDQFALEQLGNLGGTKGSISGWSIYTTNKTNNKYANYRIRYQIHGNRYCSNIKRQHKSNGIILEIDIVNAQLYQSCWDPDCRHYRSEEIHVPLALLPSYNEIEMKYQEMKRN